MDHRFIWCTMMQYRNIIVAIQYIKQKTKERALSGAIKIQNNTYYFQSSSHTRAQLCCCYCCCFTNNSSTSENEKQRRWSIRPLPLRNYYYFYIIIVLIKYWYFFLGQTMESPQGIHSNRLPSGTNKSVV